MFKLDLSEDYTWPVRVEVPDKGTVKVFTFTARFPRLPQSELDALLNDVESKSIEDGDLANRVLLGWDGVQDAVGDPLEITPANKAALLEAYPVRPAVISAFLESILGARRKN